MSPIPSSSLVSLLLMLLSLQLPPSASPCMIQGTDSGFCDTRYHPMHYSADPKDEVAWLSQSAAKRKQYILQSRQFWKPDSKATEGPCMGEGTG